MELGSGTDLGFYSFLLFKGTVGREQIHVSFSILVVFPRAVVKEWSRNRALEDLLAVPTHINLGTIFQHTTKFLAIVGKLVPNLELSECSFS